MARRSDAFTKSPHIQMNGTFAHLANSLARSYQPQLNADTAQLANSLARSYQPQLNASFAQLANTLARSYQLQLNPTFAQLARSYQLEQMLAPSSALARSGGFAWQVQKIPTPSAESQTANETMTSDSSVSPARHHNAALIAAFAVYIIAALALHISNIASTHDRVFDPHRLITDQFIAMALAIALFTSLPKE